MGAETQYIANTGMVQISNANPYLNGDSYISTVIVADSNKNGLFIKNVTVKAMTNTTEGMVRLFIEDNSSNIKLIEEIEIPAVIKSATDPTFETTIALNYCLKPGWKLRASTEKGETFNIIADAQDWAYYVSSVRADTTKYTAINGFAQIITANSNLNGTGALGDVFTSGGSNLISITVKATANTTKGMIRLFLYDGSNTLLFKEVPITAVSKSAIAQTFYHKIMFNNGFALKSTWHLKASTENGEAFNIISESLDWTYPA